MRAQTQLLKLLLLLFIIALYIAMGGGVDCHTVISVAPCWYGYATVANWQLRVQMFLRKKSFRIYGAKKI